MVELHLKEPREDQEGGVLRFLRRGRKVTVGVVVVNGVKLKRRDRLFY
jgi:hypothetical protein